MEAHGSDLTQVALILSLAFAGGLFLQKLRQPALVGYILVGMLIGPGLFGLQGNSAEIRWLAELAIVLLMFMLGMELNIQRFRAAMGVALTTVALQVVAGLGVATFFMWLFNWPLGRTVLIGFAVALSSTAVAINVLEEMKERKSPAGRLTMAVLIAQDLAVIPMLLIIGIFNEGKIGGQDILRTAIAITIIIASLAGLFWLQKRPDILDRLRQYLKAGHGQPVVAGLAVCFAAAAVSGLMGLSTAYGAFAVGLLIGNLGAVGNSYREALHHVHDLLMMVFFLSVGLMLNFEFIWINLAAIVLLVLFTMFIKTVVNVQILRLQGIPRRTSYTMGAALGQVGEFSFVLAALGLSTGLILQEGYQLVLTLIALTIILSPLWLRLVQRYSKIQHKKGRRRKQGG
jgi:CPA2 family monovalent cation:H+ antiporter-2